MLNFYKLLALGGKGGSGGGDSPVIYAHISYDDTGNIVCDMTHAELVEAYNAGKVLMCIAQTDGAFLLQGTYPNDDAYWFQCVRYLNTNDLIGYTYKVYSNGTVTEDTLYYDLGLIPMED